MGDYVLSNKLSVFEFQKNKCQIGIHNGNYYDYDNENNNNNNNNIIINNNNNNNNNNNIISINNQT